MSVVFIHSHYGPTPKPFAEMAESGRITILRDSALSDDIIVEAGGIVTTTHLDQIGFASRRKALAGFFGKGGRLFFNGHILKPFVDGIDTYRPSLARKLADLRLMRIAPHPVFGDLDPADMVTRKGVAGFYGRGHNPLPKGARALTGLGTLKQPIDWVWALPGGGMIFSHAGNDLWSMAPDGPDGARAFAERIVDWTAGKTTGEAA